MLLPDAGQRQDLLQAVSAIVGANGGLSSLETQHLAKLADILGVATPQTPRLTLASNQESIPAQLAPASH